MLKVLQRSAQLGIILSMLGFFAQWPVTGNDFYAGMLCLFTAISIVALPNALRIRAVVAMTGACALAGVAFLVSFLVSLR